MRKNITTTCVRKMDEIIVLWKATCVVAAEKEEEGRYDILLERHRHLFLRRAKRVFSLALEIPEYASKRFALVFYYVSPI